MGSVQPAMLMQWRDRPKARSARRTGVTAAVVVAAVLAMSAVAWFATGATLDDPEITLATMQTD